MSSVVVVPNRYWTNIANIQNFSNMYVFISSYVGKLFIKFTKVAQILGMNKFNQVVNNAHYKYPGDNVAFPWYTIFLSLLLFIVYHKIGIKIVNLEGMARQNTLMLMEKEALCKQYISFIINFYIK